MNSLNFKILSEKPAATIINPSMIDRRMDAGCYQPKYLKNEASLIQGRVSSKRLGTLYVKGNYGSLPDSVDYTTSGVALIRGTDLQSMTVNIDDAVKVPSYYYEQFKKAQINSGDILMLVKGASIDRSDSVAMFPETDGKAIANGSVFIIRANAKKICSRYLLAVMTTDAFLLQKRRGSSNTGALYNDLDTIKEFIVPVPDPKVQEYVGQKVKIAEKCRFMEKRYSSESNQILADGLGGTALEILEKIDQKGVLKNGGFTVQVEAELLRNRLDPIGYHPELLAIQKTFNAKKSSYQRLHKLAKLTTNERSRVNSSSSYFVSVLHVDNKGYLDRGAASEYYPESPGREAKPADILVSCINPAANRIAVCDEMNGSIACSPEFAILESKDLPPHYLAFVLRSDLVYRQMIHLGKGTSSSRRRIDEEELLELEIPVISGASQIATLEKRRQKLIYRAFQLTAEAKADVEALIEGKLDTDAIMSGKLKAPTWEDIEKELEGI